MITPVHGQSAGRPVLGVSVSASGRRWSDRLDASGRTVAMAIAQRTGIPDVVARVLAARGVQADEAASYLDPTLKALMPDPSVLVDMDVAAARLADAIERGDRIAILGDYDVDGATSSALMVRYLRAFGLDPVVSIPDRLVDGYGPNPRLVGELASGGAELLVALDCGTQSFEAFEAARTAGLPVVVLDHHQASVDLPFTEALVNPNRQDDLSGLGHLCACGVTFLALVAVNRELRRRDAFARLGVSEPQVMGLLDLVALGTVCDVVPLVGLNRAYVVKGLQVLKGRRNRGLAALADVVRLSGPASPYHLGFLLGPRINAGGRIGDAALGTRLLVSDDPVEAARISAELDRLNRERQQMEAEALAAAEAMVAARMLGSEPPPVIVTASADWHPGIVGLIAARLKERHGRPAVAIAVNADGTGTGSCRSVAGVDIGAAVRAAVAEGLALKGGGHAMAAGITIAASKVEELAVYLGDRARAGVDAALADDALAIDGALTAGGATVDLATLLERAGPFGAGQPDPVFVLPSHRVTYAEPAGNGHVRLQIAGGDGSRLKAMAFRAGDRPLGRFLLEARGQPIHLAGVIGLDHWQGEARVQLRVLDAADPRKTEP